MQRIPLKRIARFSILLSIALLLVTAPSCKKKLPPPTPPPQQEEPPPPPPPPMKTEKVVEPPIQPVKEQADTSEDLDEIIRRQNNGRDLLKTIYFDFDKSGIRDDQVPVLQANAGWLKAHPKYRLLVEGHADERDTIEYNLALGDRRARSVQQYLSDLGVAPDRIRTISYGEERPADPGHDEDAWAKNRRAEFTLEK